MDLFYAPVFHPCPASLLMLIARRKQIPLDGWAGLSSWMVSEHARRVVSLAGSGLIEGSCKTIVAQRLKRNNARWRPRRVKNIAALRCLQYSGCWESYWQHRN